MIQIFIPNFLLSPLSFLCPVVSKKNLFEWIGNLYKETKVDPS